MENDAESLIKRIIIVLADYYKLTKNSSNTTLSNLDWSVLFGANTNYSDECLVNDFNAILDHLNDDEDIENIHDQLLQKIKPKDNLSNNMREGSISYRHLMCDQWQFDSKQKLSNLYFGCNEYSDIARYKLLDRLYCHIAYAHDLGLRLTTTELQSMTIEQKEEETHDLDRKLEKLNQIISTKRSTWKQLKSEDWMKTYCDDKFVTHCNEKPSTDISETTTYSIGTRFYYEDWKYYSDNADKLKIPKECIIRGHLHANLKDEMIESNSMTLYQWILLEIVCKIYFASKKCKKLKCDILKSDGHGVDIHYGFKQGDAISLEHIISIYIYCNFPIIKQRFNQNLKSNQFSNFGRLLRETVEGFGLSVFSDNAEDEWYHNIGDNSAYFGGYLALRFCKPTLMTTSKNIINLYNYENKYVTLQLEKYTNDSSVNYFVCNWLSDYSLDNECLFIGGKYALKLQSVFIGTVFNYSHYLSAMHVLSAMIKGKANNIMLDENTLFALETLITKKIGNKKYVSTSRTDIINGDEKDEDENESCGNMYLMNIFSAFCANVTTPIYVNLIWICDPSKNGYHKIKQWITNENHSWIRFDVLCTLFPNVEKMKIGHSQFVLQHSTFDSFVELFGAEDGQKYKLKEIVIEDPDETNVSVKVIVNKYDPKLSGIGWKIESNKYFTKIFLTKKSSNNMWDDLF